MMKNVILIISSILLISCTPQKEVINTISATGVKDLKKGSKMYGKIVVKSKPILEENKETPELFFERDGVAFFINIPLGKVSKAELQKHVFKNIDIIGEIKTNSVSNASLQKSKTEEDKPESNEGLSVIIYKILE